MKMKIRRFGSIVRYGTIGAVALFCLSSTASASAIGNMNEANCSGGGATVTATTITWTPVGTLPGTGCIDTGAGTSLSYSGGTLGPGVVGNIANLTFGTPPPINDFITFTGTTLDFVLTGFNIPATTDGTNCAATTSGDTCTVFAGSPFILTNDGTSTGISLTALGTITDGGIVSDWTGIWTTQLNQTPAESRLQF